jgi:hypothetical protein
MTGGLKEKLNWSLNDEFKPNWNDLNRFWSSIFHANQNGSFGTCSANDSDSENMTKDHRNF